MSSRFKALVEADAIIVPHQEFDGEEEAEAWLEEHVATGDLGPINVRAIEEDDV